MIIANLHRSSKVGILWGGGLGDLLVLRVLLWVITGVLERRPVLMTTASHLPRIFDEFCDGVDVVRLSRSPKDLLPFIRAWQRHFDFLYLGPHPTLKTVMLGCLLAPGRLWLRRYPERPPYLVEQLRADIAAFGLPAPELDQVLANALPWKVPRDPPRPGDGAPFLALHAGAKQGWQTTRWPLEKWRALIRQILEKSNHSVCLLGIASESEMLASLRNPLPRSARSRVSLSLGQPLERLATLILSSSGVICHNSGILHLATFLKKRTLSLTGSSASCWRPCYPWVMNISSGQCELACNCYRCPVPFYRARCINGLSVEKVWQAVRNHLLEG